MPTTFRQVIFEAFVLDVKLEVMLDFLKKCWLKNLYPYFEAVIVNFFQTLNYSEGRHTQWKLTINDIDLFCKLDGSMCTRRGVSSPDRTNQVMKFFKLIWCGCSSQYLGMNFVALVLIVRMGIPNYWCCCLEHYYFWLYILFSLKFIIK